MTCGKDHEVIREENVAVDAATDALLDSVGAPRAWWWLSFCDTDRPVGEQFLGVAVVQGHSFSQAVDAAWTFGVNPGGQVAGWEIPDDQWLVPPESLFGRLLSRREVEEMGPHIR